MRAGMLWPPAPPSPCLVFLALFLAACAPQTEARGFTLRARVPDEPLSLAEAVARGRAVRPVVVEATPDEQTLSPAFERLSGVDDDQRAFGRKVGDALPALLALCALFFSRQQSADAPPVASGSLRPPLASPLSLSLGHSFPLHRPRRGSRRSPWQRCWRWSTRTAGRHT